MRALNVLTTPLKCTISAIKLAGKLLKIGMNMPHITTSTDDKV